MTSNQNPPDGYNDAAALLGVDPTTTDHWERAAILALTGFVRHESLAGKADNERQAIISTAMTLLRKSARVAA